MSLMNPIGIIGSFIFPFVFVDPDADIPELKTQIYNMMFGFTAVTVSWLIITIVSYFENTHKKALAHLVDKTSRLQEESFEEPEEEAEVPIMKQISTLLHDKSYIGMLLASSIVFGSFGGVGVAVNFLLTVWGYD